MMVVSLRFLMSWVGLCLLAGTCLGFLPAVSDAADTATKPLEATIVKSSDQAKQQQAQDILSRILSANQLDGRRIKEVTVVAEDHLNAATDGNTIYFYEGLWDQLPTEDEKAFVIAHEMGHVYANHIVKGTTRKVGLTLANQWLSKWLSAKNTTTAGLLQVAVQGGMMLTDLRFDRSAEYQADALGLSYLGKAGFNPQAAVDTLAVLQAADTAGTPQFLRSHPLSENRIKALAAEEQRLQTARMSQNVNPVVIPGATLVPYYTPTSPVYLQGGRR